jgi:hypothetical protein
MPGTTQNVRSFTNKSVNASNRIESRFNAPWVCLVSHRLIQASIVLGILLGLSISAEATETASASSPHAAVERGLQFLRKEAYRWKETRKCAACHHAPTMIWTFNEARRRGYTVDEAALKEITAWAFSDMKQNSLTPQAPPRDVINLGWVYVLLSMETDPGFKTLSAQDKEHPPEKPGSTNETVILSARQTLLEQIIRKQGSEGSWGQPLDERVPLGGPREDIAILSRLALLESGEHTAAVTNCIKRAGDWLAAYHEQTSRQGRNLRLLTAALEGASAAEMNTVIAAIRNEQNEDGGWSQTPEMPSDAYATGQTLYVLARSGVTPDAAEMKRGVEFLTHTQLDNGSWPMTSRVQAKNLTPITAAGAQWAVLGLLRASI